MKVQEPLSLCDNCREENRCGCSSIQETLDENYDMVEEKYNIKMKVVVWDCPNYDAKDKSSREKGWEIG